MPIFAETIALLRASECHLLSEQESELLPVAYFKRIVWQPMKFLRMGMAEKTRGAMLWSFLSFASLMIGAALVNNAGAARTEVANWIMISSMVAPMFLVVFAMPSMYADSGVRQASVSFIVKHLQARGFSNTTDVELLKKSLKPFEERARARVTVLKWLVGLVWAAFMYMFTKGIDASAGTPEQLRAYAFGSAFLFMFVIGAYLLVWGYEASLDKLFRLIEFGCNDFCHLAELTPPMQLNSHIKCNT
jgi:hypothetical protein